MSLQRFELRARFGDRVRQMPLLVSDTAPLLRHDDLLASHLDDCADSEAGRGGHTDKTCGSASRARVNGSAILAIVVVAGAGAGT